MKSSISTPGSAVTGALTLDRKGSACVTLEHTGGWTGTKAGRLCFFQQPSAAALFLCKAQEEFQSLKV